MIPLFPQFKKLTDSDQKHITEITNKYDPYSDFNFTSVYSYNTLELAEISVLNNNLVMKFTDYESNLPFYTFLGDNRVQDTLQQVIDRSIVDGFGNELKLIPEINIKSHLDTLADSYEISEDRDNFDYVYSLENLATLSGRHYDGHRNLVKRFHESFAGIKIEEITLVQKDIQQKISDLVFRWGKNKNKTEDEIKTEFSAIERLLNIAPTLNLTAIGAFDNDILVGFSIEEVLSSKWAIAHFGKADITYHGIFQVMEHEHAKRLHAKGIELLNYEQDLGISGLRQSKQNWKPIGFLKKYKIKPKA